jgi:hypothetical protein
MTSSVRVWGAIPPEMAIPGNVVRFTPRAVEAIHAREAEREKKYEGMCFVNPKSPEDDVPITADARYVVHIVGCWSFSRTGRDMRYVPHVTLEEVNVLKRGIFRLYSPHFSANAQENEFNGVEARVIVNLLPVDVLEKLPKLRQKIFVRKKDGRFRRATILGLGINVDRRGQAIPEVMVSNPAKSEHVGEWHIADDAFYASISWARPKTYGQVCGLA